MRLKAISKALIFSVFILSGILCGSVLMKDVDPTAPSPVQAADLAPEGVSAAAEDLQSLSESDLSTGPWNFAPLGQIEPVSAQNPLQLGNAQTTVRSFYSQDGSAPQAPGLAMRDRIFSPEPNKVAYLTIDDGPYPDTTPAVLDILEKEGVRATFFVVGRQVEKYPQLVKAEHEAGHGIGNHTYSHDYNQLYQSPAHFLAEIHKTEDLIYNITGLRPRVIRVPGGTAGHFTAEYFNAVDLENYLVYDWNVSAADTSGEISADQIVENVKEQTAGKQRVMILMHDTSGKTATIEALPRIIQYLREQGYAFGVITPEVRPIIFAPGLKGE